MLLAIDVGNTQTVFGIYDGPKLCHHCRLQTNWQWTVDEYGVRVRNWLAAIAHPPIGGVAVACVVPALIAVFDVFCRTYLEVTPLFAGPGMHTGMRILYDDPRELGTDRIVNAVAAYARTRDDTIVVDMGTAMKFEYVSRQGDYVGGAIAPGLGIASDALFEHAAKLYRVELAKPRHVVGRNMVEAIQSGLVYGYAALVDGMVRRIQKEHNVRARVIATGGFAPLLVPESDSIDEMHEFLTLDGLRLIYERNSDQ